MPQERAFLDEITANPAYRMARLVYADWLDEKGDARAELIRIEEEMWSTPIWADRYWQLKPRRNELRATCDKKWLDWMNYGNHVEPVFREVPNGWRERWRLLRECVERWHGLPMPDVGFHSATIAEMEKRLAVTLPPSFREWIAFASDLRERFGDVMFHDFLVTPLAMADGGRAITLLHQPAGGDEYGEAFWAVETDWLWNDDPPVVSVDSDVEPTLTLFVLSHFIDHLPGSYAARAFSPREIAKLQQPLAEAFPVRTTFDDVQVFERPDMIALLRQDDDSNTSTLRIKGAKTRSSGFALGTLRGLMRAAAK